MAYGELKVDSITFTNGGTDTTVSVSGLVQNPTFSGDITVTGTISGDVVRGGTLVSGATVTGNAAQFTTLTGGAAGFTTVTGTTVTGTTANFATLSGTTVTGGTGQFTSLTSTTATITSGVFASGTAAAPSVSVGTTSNGLYSPGTDQVALSTNGTGRLFVDANGNVGVGTTSASHTLQVAGAVCATGSFGTASANTITLDTLLFGEGRIMTTGPAIGGYNPLIFSQLTSFGLGYIERARIDSSGRLLVGTPASPTYQLQLDTDSAGKPSTNTWTIVSDERIKEEIELADLDLCYEAVKNIPLKRFKWKDEVYTEDQAYDRRKLGWIAQDVEAVFPKAVRRHEFKYNQVFEKVIVPAVPAELDEDGNVITEEQPERIEKGELISEEVIEDCRDLNSDQLYAAMYGAIQKLISKVETLEAEIAALKV